MQGECVANGFGVRPWTPLKKQEYTGLLQRKTKRAYAPTKALLKLEESLQAGDIGRAIALGFRHG